MMNGWRECQEITEIELFLSLKIALRTKVDHYYNLINNINLQSYIKYLFIISKLKYLYP